MVDFCEVPEQPNKEPYVRHLIKQVLVLELVGLLVSNRLLKRPGAVALLGNELVGDHLARLATEILQLI